MTATPRTPEQIVMAAEGARLLEQAMGTLTARNADIVRMRFGLDPYERIYSLREVAAKYSTGYEWIRQIEMKALRILKHPSRRVGEAAGLLGLVVEGHCFVAGRVRRLIDRGPVRHNSPYVPEPPRPRPEPAPHQQVGFGWRDAHRALELRTHAQVNGIAEQAWRRTIARLEAEERQDYAVMGI